MHISAHKQLKARHSTIATAKDITNVSTGDIIIVTTIQMKLHNITNN